MPLATMVRELDLARAEQEVTGGAAYVDLRDTEYYLDVHIPGSLALLYEYGPGMAGRARDCLPLSLRLILLDHGGIDIANAAAALRGKGFTVVGTLRRGVETWGSAHGHPASTEIVCSEPSAAKILHVGDPGAVGPQGALDIPIEHLWDRAGELASHRQVAVVARTGVRASLAVGMLELAGVPEILLWRPQAGPTCGATANARSRPW